MKYRKHRGFKVSEVGVGCYSLSGVYGAKNREEFRRMLNRAYELGVNFFDTADIYGDAEQILGEVMKPHRGHVCIATKVGVTKNIKTHLEGKYVKKACEKSLERLQTDYIDLYQVHFDDPHTAVEETVDALEELVDDGKIRRYGVGHLPLERLETYCRIGNVFSVLTELSAVARSSRKNVLPLCRRYDVAAIAFSTTGRGLLTGKIRVEKKFEPRDIRNMDPLFRRECFASGLRVAGKLSELGKRYGKTPAQVAIAWVLTHPEITCALTGPSTIPHLEENLEGSGWSISGDDLEELELFFKAEDAWLERAQKSSIRQILSKQLPHNPSQAVADLIYVIENSTSPGLTTEEGILPVFQELWGLRKAKKEGLRSRLETIQNRLREMIDRESHSTPDSHT